MQRAVNPQTGEVLFLVDNKWTPPAQTAKNDSGDTAYLVGNKWEVVKTARPPEPILSPEDQAMSGAAREAGLPPTPVSQSVNPNSMTADEYRAQVAAREAKGYDRTLGGSVIDSGVTLLKGAIGLPEAFVGLADIPTLGYAGKLLEQAGYRPKEAKAILDTYLSEAQQYANRQVKETKGFLPTIGAALQNPSTIATAIGESLPQMIGGAGIARGILKAAPGLTPYLAGAAGEGLLGAGAAAEQIRQGTKDKLLTGKQALSAVGSGVGTAAFGVAGGKLAKKFGLDDIDTLLVGGGAQTGSKSVKDFATRATASGINEGVFEEMPQSAQETMWMNYATDKPLLEGVPEAAGMGLVTGATMGFGATAAGGRRKQAPQTPTPTEAAAPTAPEVAPIAPIAPIAPEVTPEVAPPSASQDTDAMLQELLAPTISVKEVELTPNLQEEEAAEEKPAPAIEAPAAEAPKEEVPAEPTLKEQYDKAAKLNFVASDAFRERRINQEQYDKIQSDYARLKAEYQASVPKAELNPIQQEATDIADRLEAFGQKPFVSGMRTAIEKNQVNEQNLEFYRSKLKQEQAKQGTLEEGIERPSEKWSWSNFYSDEPKGQDKLKLFNSKAKPEAKQALQTITDSIQAVTDRLNDEGYTMYGASDLNVPKDIKDLRSQIQTLSANGSILINKFEALNKGFNRSKKTTNQENLDAAIEAAKVGAAEAQKSLQRSIPEPQEVVEARGTLAQAGKQIDELTYKSGSLWSALAGKLDPEEVREIFGRNPSLGNKKLQVTKKSGKRGTYITELAADGLLDPFLPPAMRHESSRFDAAESAQYIKDLVGNKEYLPYDVKEEIKNIQEGVEPFGDLIDEYLTIEEQNRELQIAFDEQREADQAAEIVEPEGEDRVAEPSERPAGELELTAPTKDELKSKQDEIDRLSKENERLSKEAERKAKADEEAKDFVLTGSKREADQAAARGQKDIFAEDNTFNPVELGKEFPEIGAEAFAYLDTTNAKVRKAIGALYKEGDIDGAIDALENMPKNIAVVEKPKDNKQEIADLRAEQKVLIRQIIKAGLQETPEQEARMGEIDRRINELEGKAPVKPVEKPEAKQRSVEEIREELEDLQDQASEEFNKDKKKKLASDVYKLQGELAIAEGRAARAASEEEPTQEPPDLQPALGTIERLAKEYNGEVVFGDDDLGLVLAYGERTGEPLYVPYVKDAMFRNDIEQFPAKSFKLSDADYQKLVNAKRDLEQAAIEKHEKTPFLKMGEGVTGSKGIPGNVLSVTKGWAKMLNLTGNIHVMTDEEALRDKDKFTGPHRAIGYIGFLGEPGMVKKTGSNEYIVVVRKSTSTGKTLEVLAHELGHIHQGQTFEKADADTKNAVIKEFNKWFEKSKAGTAGELIKSMRAKRMARATKGDKDIPALDMQKRQYWFSFGEWYADQTSRWATTNTKPVGVVEQFFSRLGKAIRSFFSKAQASKYLPNETFVEYLEKVSSVTDLTDPTEVFKGDQIPLFASEDIGGRAPPNTARRNYLGEEAPEPDMEIPEMSFMDDVIYKYGDKLIDTKRLIQSIQSTGRKINERFDAYMKEENYHGRLAKRTKNFLNSEMRPVLEDMQERGVTLDELETFLLNRHAKEANAYIAKINPTGFPEAGSSVSDADADKYMAELTPEKRKDLMALAAKVDAIVKETQRVLVANGLETQDTIDEWNATYKNYVPLQRDNLDFVHTGRGVMGGFATRGSASKRRVGSDKPVIDIFANIAMQRERALRRSEQARVGRALYGMAIKHPNPGFWLAINPDAIKDKDKLEAELISLGLTPEDARSIIQEPRQPMFDKKTGTVKYQVNPLLRNSPNVFPIRINGEDRFIFFNPNDPRALRMVESIKNLDTEKLGDAIGTVGMVTRWFASVNTQYNIVFGGVNFLRDLGAASLNLSTTEIAGKEKQVRANVLPALRAIYRELRGKGATTKEMAEMQNWFERFQLAGGQTGYQNQFAETKRKGNVVEQELKRLNRGNVKKSVDAIFDWLSDYNDAIENAVRLSAFKVAVENGLSEDKAASIAKNLTVNFNRKGARTGLISSLYAFFNAAVQGSARMVETLRGPMGKKIIFGGMFLGSMQAIALAMAGFDDDEPPEFVKDKNLIIPIPYTDKKYLSIPMPLGFNMFPGFGRLAMETLLIETGMIRSRKGPGDKVMSAVSLVFDAFNPLGGAGNPLLMAMPTILDPFAAIYSNKDAFGRPIYREDKGTAPTPGYERSRENASVFSKKLAEAINWATSPAGTQHTKGFFSPTADQIDYFIGQITGGVGRELMKVGEFAKSKAVTQEEVPAYKLPIVGRFYGEAESPAATRSRFYENVKEMAKHEHEIKGLRKDRISPTEYIKANPEARLWQRANNVENQIVKLNKEKRAMIERDAPREALKRKEDEILKKMTEFNDQVRRGQ